MNLTHPRASSPHLPLLLGSFALLISGSLAKAANLLPDLTIERIGQTPYVKTGPLVGWSDGISGAVRPIPADLTDVVKLAASPTAVVAMKRDGTVVTFSGSSVEPGPVAVTNAKELAFTIYGPAALSENGVVWFWDSPTSTSYNPGTSFIHGLEGGYGHLLTLQGSGDVVAWLGANSYGEKNVPAGLNGTAIAVAAGGNHSMAIKQDGSVVAWGRNHKNQCNVPASLTGVRVKAIAGGLAHSLALKEDGTVVAWGDNSQGQTTVPVGLSDVREIHAGDYHSVAVTTAGRAIFWGKPQVLRGIPSFPAPKVGVMTASGSETFAGVEVPGHADFGNVAPGSQSHITFVLRNKGQTTAQITGISLVQPAPGFSVSLQPGLTSVAPGKTGLFTASYAPAASGPATATLRVKSSDPLRPEWDIVLTAGGYIGKPVATPLNLTTPEDTPLTIQLAGTDREGDFLRYSVLPPVPAGAGTVTLGSGAAGQAVFTPAKDFHGEATFTYLVNDGGSDSEPATVKIAVTPVNDPPVATYLPTTITAFSSGGSVPVYFRPPVFTDPEDGEIPVAMTWRNPAQAFSSGTVMFPETHTITVRGTDSAGATLTRSFTIKVYYRPMPGIQVSAPGMDTARSATFLEWNQSGFLNEAPTDLVGIKQIAYGRDHGFALKNDGSVVGWGAADLNQLAVPASVFQFPITKIACGWNHTLALTSTGKVLAWGPDNGALLVSSFTDIVDIAAGNGFSLGLKANGTIQVQISDGNQDVLIGYAREVSNAKAIAAGAQHVLALKTDGTVVAFGRNTEGQSSVPFGLSGVVAIAAGPYHSLALTSNGSVVTWGRMGDGALPPTVTGSFKSISAGWYHHLGKRSSGPLASWGRFAPGGTVLNPNLPGGAVPAEVSAATVMAAGNGRSGAALAPPPYVIDLGQVPLDAVVTRSVTVRPAPDRTLNVNAVERVSGNPRCTVDTTGMVSSIGQNQSTSFKVNFSPQSLGPSTAIVRILSNDPNESEVRIEFRAVGTLPDDYLAWAAAAGLNGSGTLEELEAVRFPDGLSNLMKFAFNLDPTRHDYRLLAPGSGTVGLPHISLEQQSGGPRFLRVEYLRRRSGSVSYRVEHSPSLGVTFQQIPITPEIFPIDEVWERAVVRQPIDPATAPKGFARVRVSFAN